MAIARGTTPKLNIAMLNSENRNIDLSDYSIVILTISDGKHQVDVEKDDMTFNADFSIDCSLTQTETLTLLGSLVKVQIRAKESDGTTIASDIVTMPLQAILKEGQI